MAVKATNQIDLIDLTDGYTINLSSDAHTFIGSEDRVNGTQSIATQVSAYRGNTAIGCTIGTITGAEGAALPSGITAAVGTGTEPIITITATEVTYQSSSNGTTAPTGTWSSTIPSVPTNHFLWTKTYVKYSDNKETTSYSVSRNAKDGAAGTSVTVTTT